MGEQKKITNTLVEIQTKHLPNISLQCESCTNLLDAAFFL
jgi:hypothetical protein